MEWVGRGRRSGNGGGRGKEEDRGGQKMKSSRKRLKKRGKMEEMTGLKRAKPGWDRRRESMRQPEKDR